MRRPRLRLFRQGPRLRLRVRGFGRRVASPPAELFFAAVVALFGAWLIALWVVGLLVIVIGCGLAADALLRDTSPAKSEPQSRHEEILEQWRNAR